MFIQEAFKKLYTTGVHVRRRAWSPVVFVFVGPLYDPGPWFCYQEGEVVKMCRFIPTMQDYIEDDWDAADKIDPDDIPRYRALVEGE